MKKTERRLSLKAESGGTKDVPGVIAPPPLIYLGGLVLGVAIDWLVYGFPLLPPAYLGAGRLSGLALTVSGLGVILIAKRMMHRAMTNIEPWKPTNSIISGGIYAYSRNPVYVSMTVIYIGLTLIFNSLWALLLLAFVLGVIEFGVIRREERYLEAKFGAQYAQYKTNVRRWL